MSGIVGIVNRDARPVNAAELTAMVDAISHRGPDGKQHWTDTSCGLGHLRLCTSEDSGGLLPLFDRDRGLCVTADVRLDNDKELRQQLGVKGVRCGSSDADLILAAYESWGEGCAERLIGDFAVAVWDCKEQTLFLARDRFGVKPLFYYSSEKIFGFASEIKALFRLRDLQPSINDQMVGDHLTGAHLDPELTFYKGIVRMPPAHTIVIEQNKERRRSYWTLDPAREIKLASDREYAEAFRERFTESVRCRLKGTRGIASTLSGGLDSSSIASVAQDLIRRGNGDRLRTYSLVFDESPESDERPFINAAVAKAGFSSRQIRADSFGALSELQSIIWHADKPVFAPNLFLHWGLHRESSQEGVRVLLDGFDGDSVVSHGHQFLNELASKKCWLKLTRETLALSRTMGERPWPTLKPYVKYFGWDPLVSRSSVLKTSRRVWRRLTRGRAKASGGEGNPQWRDLLAPEFVRSLRIEERYRDWRRIQPHSVRTERDGHFRILTQPSLPMALDILDTTAAAFGTEVRYPFWDSRLVEFCLALPPEQKLHGGLGRMVMRRALSDVLPQEIQNRGTKTDFISVFDRALVSVDRRYLDEILQETSDLECYVSGSAVKRLYRRIVDGPRPAAPADLLNLWRVLTLAVWFRAPRVHR